MKQWLTVDGPTGVVVLPLDDDIVHTRDVHCPCRPTVTRVGTTCWCDGIPKARVRVMVTHQAIDGRE